MLDQVMLRSQRVVLENEVRQATIVIEGGVIVSIESGHHPGAVDVGNAAIIPGAIDPHVHLNEPGRTDWEGFETGTRAAAAGGITTLCDMPLNSSPVTTNVAALRAKQQAAQGKLSVEVGFHAGVVPGNAAEIEPLLQVGVLGVKAFLCHSGIDDFPNVGEADLQKVMPLLAHYDVPLLAHAEIAEPAYRIQNGRSYKDYLRSRPPEFERQAIEMLIRLAKQTGCKVHIVHLADAGSIPMLREARAGGLPITVETCPHYLCFAAEEIPEGATQFKCAPPIRDRDNREKLWQGLKDGDIDLIASDHSPCPPEMKQLDTGRFDLAWGGVSSLQLGLQVIHSEAIARGFQLTDVMRWMCTEPAKLLGLRRGLAVGMPANLVVFDEQAQWTIDAAELYHRHRVTPYDGRQVQGQVKQTYVHGRLYKTTGSRPEGELLISRRDKMKP